MGLDDLTRYTRQKAFLQAIADSDIPIKGRIRRADWPTKPRELLRMVCPFITIPGEGPESVMETEHYNTVIGALKGRYRSAKIFVSTLERRARDHDSVEAYLRSQEPSPRVVQQLLWS